MDKEIYDLREKKSDELILRGTMEQINRWLDYYQEKDVVYEISKTRYPMSSNVTKCHQMSLNVIKCH